MIWYEYYSMRTFQKLKKQKHTYNLPYHTYDMRYNNSVVYISHVCLSIFWIACDKLHSDQMFWLFVVQWSQWFWSECGIKYNESVAFSLVHSLFVSFSCVISVSFFCCCPPHLLYVSFKRDYCQLTYNLCSVHFPSCIAYIHSESFYDRSN